MSDYLDPNNEELLKDFFAEAQGQVETFENHVLILENDSHNKDAVDEIFRAAHTLKGGASTVHMFEIAEFTHTIEDVLDEIRSDAIQMSSELVDILLQAIDVIKAMLEARLAGNQYQEDVTPLQNQLKKFLGGNPSKKIEETLSSAEVPAQSKPTPEKEVKVSSSELTEYDFLELKEAAQGQVIYQVIVSFDENNPMNSVGGIQVFAALKEVGTVLKTIPDFDKLYEDTYYPIVEYFALLQKDPEIVEKKCHIAEVTTQVRIIELREESTDEAKSSSSQQQIVQTTENIPNDTLTIKTIPSFPQESAKTSLTSISPLKNENSGNKESPEHKKSVTNAVGSILRVDSKRIDTLLNLVSETVINKATFNQISNQFNEILIDIQNISSHYKNQIKDLFEKILEYVNDFNKGRNIKDIRKSIYDEFSGLSSAYDPVEGKIKTSVSIFHNTAQNLGRIIGELHEGVLRIRMVPIAQIFSRFPRLARDLSKILNKKINLIIEGEETELDKSVVEDLLDPLIHCIRNSIDHGIELPETRTSLGKPEEGTVKLSAANEGNMIEIKISDDGKGIDVETIKKKAIEKGLLHPGKNLTDQEAFKLIFEPGFSTAATITNISGRGVGLDVVRKQIEKINGSLTIWSEKSKGSQFTIKLPLTLAIIQGLLVRVGREVYAIPITSVIDSHRIKLNEISIIDNYEVFNVRKEVISLLRLNRLFGIHSDESALYYYIVVVGSGDRKMGLMVDALIGEEDVVIKPLKDQYTTSPGIAGATILGNGKVSLIIDVGQLLELSFKNEKLERQKREK